MRLIGLLMLVGLGCASATDPTLTPDFTVGVGEPIELRVGEAVEVAGGARIAFTGVVADSRCPSSVVCVYAGDAAVELKIRYEDTVRVDTLHTLMEPKSVAVAGIGIHLAELAPYPDAPGIIPQRTYVATLTFDDVAPSVHP